MFAAFLFTHNSKVGMLCFALGFAAGVPVIYLLFTTGLSLGALAALYETRGLGPELWAWVLPHGVTELSAVCLCGAAGMVIGSSLVFPGRHTRLRNLALHGREVALLAVGAVVDVPGGGDDRGDLPPGRARRHRALEPGRRHPGVLELVLPRRRAPPSPSGGRPHERDHARQGAHPPGGHSRGARRSPSPWRRSATASARSWSTCC